MISDLRNAKALLDALFEASGILDESIGAARDSCPETEFVANRRAVRDPMGQMGDQTIRPILKIIRN